MIDLKGRVAIVTGAGGGLGRAHSLLLARRGARVVVNDLGAGAEAVAEEIAKAGGEAIAVQASVTDYAAVEAMAASVMEQWGRIAILVNNAGILRDKSFAKMALEDFRLVMEVHLMGSVNCTKAVWDIMRAQNYGRIVMTTSSSGLYGNFGQSNYGAAKMALVGLMQTLGIEGARYNIHVNCVAPTASTAMTGGVLPEDRLSMLQPELVSPAVLALIREDAPNRTILCAGAGAFEAANITLTQGVMVGSGDHAADQLVAQWDRLVDRSDEIVPEEGWKQSLVELTKAGYIADEAA